MNTEKSMEIYNSLSRPPETALKTISAGKLKGKSDINPQWRYKAMTEKFGLIGFGWKYEIQKLWTEPGAKGEVLCFAQTAVYIKDGEQWSDAIVGIGGSKLVNAFSTGVESNDEGYKMAVTDSFSTALKMIGVAADVYAGKWDGSKYKDETFPNNTDKVKNSPVQKPPLKPKAPVMTAAQAGQMKQMFSDSVFSKKEQDEFRRQFATGSETAAEFIQRVSREHGRRINYAIAKEAAQNEEPVQGEIF